MGPVERFTRDAASKYVWALMLLVGIVALVVTIAGGGRAVEEERLASERRAVAVVDGFLDSRLHAFALTAPITGAEEAGLRDALERTILDDRIARVRMWSRNGELLFSTDRADDPGSRAALRENLEVLRRVADGTTITRWNLSDTGGIDESGRSLVRTYAPIGSNTVVEIDQAWEGTIAPVRSVWLSYQILAGGLVLLFLLLTILSLREPIERINTGVSFAPSSIPAGYSLIDDERLHAVEEVYRLAHDRVARLEEKLAASEAMRRRLEGDIQRALTKAATGTPMPVPSGPPAGAPADTTAPPPVVTPPGEVRRPAAATAAPPAAAPSPTNDRPSPVKKRRSRPPAEDRPAASAPPPTAPQIVTVPESEALGEAVAGKPGGPLARAVRENGSSPQLRPKPVPDKPKRAPKRKRKPEPVVPAPRAVQPDIDDAKAHEAALETFIRLTESDRQHAEEAEVDTGAVRAALARTAARKKPGGQRLQPHEGEESAGGPPRPRS